MKRYAKTAACLMAFAVSLGWVAPGRSQLNGTLSGSSSDVWRMKSYRPLPIPDDSRLSAPDRARIVMDNYARCLLLHDKRRVERLLQLSGYAAVQAANKLVVNDCLDDGDMRFTTALLLGSFYRIGYDVYFAQRAEKPAFHDMNYDAELAGYDGPERATRLALLQFADCVARADPDDVRKLLLSPTASTSEKESLRALSSHFSACLPTGTKVELSKSVMIGSLAEIMYRQSAPAASAVAGHS